MTRALRPDWSFPLEGGTRGVLLHTWSLPLEEDGLVPVHHGIGDPKAETNILNIIFSRTTEVVGKKIPQPMSSTMGA